MAFLRGKGEREVFILFDHRPVLSFETVLFCINTGETFQELLPTEMCEDRGVVFPETKIAEENYWQHAHKSETDAGLSCVGVV